MNVLISFLIIIASSLSFSAQAAIEATEFEDSNQEARYKSLIAELRCAVCQNQNLADSDAPLAKDLRDKTADMIRNGKSNQEIKTFMVDRYGEFVLYRPPFSASTAFLWLAPLTLLLIVVAILFRRIKHKHDDELLRATRADDEAVRVKARNLLSNAPKLDSDK